MIRKPCLALCGAFARPGGSRCYSCERRWRRERYESPEYRRLSKPSGRCSLQLSPKCTGIATSRDHVDGDATNHDPSNIVGACVFCNSAKGGR